MDSDVLSVLAPLGVFFVVAAIVATIRRRYVTPTGRIGRAMRAVPRRPIAALDEGEEARIVGTVATRGEPLRSPLSGTRCAVFDVLVRRRGSRAAISLDGGKVTRESEVRDFYVDDGTGKVLVHAEDAEVLLSPTVHELSGTGRWASGEVLRYLEGKGVALGGALGAARRLVCSEGTLAEGERVAVVGVVRREPQPGDEKGARLVLEPRGSGPVLVSDHPSVLR